MSDSPISQFDGELAAIRHQREMESLSGSLGVNKLLEGVTDLAENLGLPGCGLFRRALKSGQAPIETVVGQLETAALAEILRIQKHDEGQDLRLREFETRLSSQEAQSAYLIAILHGIRTADPKKHFRLGTLAINCIYVDDTKPESLDSMMRAAVELSGQDVAVLKLSLR